MASRISVLNQALQLPRDERADVARRLIASLDDASEGNVEAAWLAEVERRFADVECTAELESWEVVRDRIAARLNAKRR